MKRLQVKKNNSVFYLHFSTFLSKTQFYMCAVISNLLIALSFVPYSGWVWVHTMIDCHIWKMILTHCVFDFDLHLAGCETFEQLLKTFRLSRGMLGEIMSAYEFLDSECMRLLNAHLKLPNPISGSDSAATRCRSACSASGVTPPAVLLSPADCPFYIVIETSGSDAAHDGEKLHNFLDAAMTSSLVTDGTVATEESKIKVLVSLLDKTRVCICTTFIN